MLVEVKSKENILLIRLSGKWFSEDQQNISKVIQTFLDKKKIRNFIYDIRTLDITISTLEIFKLFSSDKPIFTTGTCHAIVYSPATFLNSEARFAETVACNRGAIMKWFRNINDAKLWLLNLMDSKNKGNSHEK